MRAAVSSPCGATNLMRSAPPAVRCFPSEDRRKDGAPCNDSEGAEGHCKASVRPEAQQPGWELQVSPQQLVFRDVTPLARRKAPLIVLNKGRRSQRVTVWPDRSNNLRIGSGSELNPEPVACPLLPPGLSLRVLVEAPPLLGPAVLTALTVKGAGREVRVPVEALPPLMGFSCPSQLSFPPAVPGHEQQQLIPITNLSNCTTRVHVQVGHPLSTSLQRLLQQRLLHVACYPQELTLEPTAVGLFTVVVRLDCPAEVNLPLYVVSKKMSKQPSSHRGSLAVPQSDIPKPSPVRRPIKPEPKLVDAIRWTGEGAVVEGQIQIHALCAVPRWALTAGRCDVKSLDFGTAYYGQERRIKLEVANLSALPLELVFTASNPSYSHEAAKSEQGVQQKQQEPQLSMLPQVSCGPQEKSPQETKSCSKGLSASRPGSARSQDNCSGASSKSEKCRCIYNGAATACVGAHAPTFCARSNFDSGRPPSGCCCNSHSPSSAVDTPSPGCKEPAPGVPSDGTDACPYQILDNIAGMEKALLACEDSSVSSFSRNKETGDCPALYVPYRSMALLGGMNLLKNGAREADRVVTLVTAQGEPQRPRDPAVNAKQSRTLAQTARETEQSSSSSSRSQAASAGDAHPHPSRQTSYRGMRGGPGRGRKEGGGTEVFATKSGQQRWGARPLMKAIVRGSQQVLNAAPERTAVPEALLPQGGAPYSACQGPLAAVPKTEVDDTYTNQHPCLDPSQQAVTGPAAALSIEPVLRPLRGGGSGDLYEVEVSPDSLLLPPYERVAIELKLRTRPCELHNGFQHLQTLQALRVPLAFQLQVHASVPIQWLPPCKIKTQALNGRLSNSSTCPQRRPDGRQAAPPGTKSISSITPTTLPAASPAALAPHQSSRSKQGFLTDRPPAPPCKGKPIVARLRPASASGSKGFICMREDGTGDAVAAQPHPKKMCKEDYGSTLAQQQAQSLFGGWQRTQQPHRSRVSTPCPQDCFLADRSCKPPAEKAVLPALPALVLPLLPFDDQDRCCSRGEGGSSPSQLTQPLRGFPWQQGHADRIVSGRCVLYLPCVRIWPRSLHFGECCMGDRRKKSFSVFNPNSQLPLDIWMDAPHPFRCEPSSFQLLPQQQLTVQVLFYPQRLGPVRHRLKISFCRRLYSETLYVSGSASCPRVSPGQVKDLQPLQLQLPGATPAA